MTVIKNFIEEGLKLGKIKLGIGLARPDDQVLESLRKGKEYADIVLVGPKEIESIEDFEKVISDTPERTMVEMLVEEKFDAIVRGTLDEFKAWDRYVELVGEEKTKDCLFAGAFSDLQNRELFLAFGSNVEGWTVEKRIKLCESLAQFFKEISMAPKIGVICGRRDITYERKKDSNEEVDKILNKTYEEAEEATKHLTDKGIDAKNYGIETETALKEGCNIICPPNGMVGNQMFRMLALICGGKSICAPRANIPHVYEECSRSEKDFLPHVRWVVAWANKRKQKGN